MNNMSLFKVHITTNIVTFFIILACHNGNLVTSERILTSPRVTAWGKWGKWEYCPAGYYVNGMQLHSESHRGTFLDDRGLTGIRLFCNAYGQNTQNYKIYSQVDTVGSWGRTYFCEGLMTGFQLRSEAFQSIIIDDTAGNNLRMYCDQSQSHNKEGDGTSFGTWTAKQLCSPREAICGISTQIDNRDRTGLNNVMMKCCDIPHPVKSCVPTTTWKLVNSCDAMRLNSTDEGTDKDKSCNYTRKIGISYADDISSPTKQLNEKMGFGISSTSSMFHSKFLNHSISGKGQELKPKNDYRHWQFSPSYVWELQTSAKTSISVKKGSKILLYQLHGTCGVYQVWGTKLKAVKHFLNQDGTEQISEKFIDFTNDDADYIYE
ncbi:unnamed protein product [Orchesella dallaii]|uniref:Vitelline membrane outer layer protein 1 n=1 Tax=Orchesella dallaii TaxID=48710 RepID=A0ABP1QH27_9HEXA